MHRLITFFLLTATSAAFVALGLLLAFKPALYARWVAWSGPNRLWTRKWDAYSSQSRSVGLAFAVFGLTALALSIWIYSFE